MFGTFERDLPYLRRKFQSPEFDPATGMDQESAKEKIAEFAALPLPPPVIKAKGFEFLAKNLQIEVDPRDFFPAFGCWSRRPCVMSRLLQEMGKKVETRKWPLAQFLIETGAASMYIDFDHSTPEWEMIFRLGFPGLLENAMHHCEKHRRNGTLDERKAAYFEGIRITWTSILLMLERFIERGRSRGEPRCLFTAEALQRLHDGPPQNFFDALLLIYMYWMFGEIMDHMQVRTLGNLDQLLTPFYDRDLANGTFTDAQMREMFDGFFMQWGSMDNYWGQPVYLGGTRPDGSTAVNRVTHLILEEAAKLNLPTPKIQIKIASNTPDALIDKVTAMIRDRHQSIVLVGEEAIRHMLTSFGATEEEARTAYVSGCYEFGLKGKRHSNVTSGGAVNMLKPFELIFNRGKDPRTGKELGPAVPELSGIASFDDFYRLYLDGLKWIVSADMEVVNEYEAFLDRINPANVLSANIPRSLELGRDAFHDGSDFNVTTMQFTGFGSAVDCLSVVENMVFKTGEVSLPQLAEALAANWKGYELLHRKIRNCKFRYGNGIPGTDRFAVMLSRTIGNWVNGLPNARGGFWKASGHPARAFINQGLKTGATPDGRFAGEEMSKNLSPAVGSDLSGVTATIKSFLTIDGASFPGDYPLDVMMHPSSVRGADGLEAWRRLIRVFFAGKGGAVHFNISDPEELKAAQREPEKHQGLQIRVSGWNIHFTKMDKSEQDMYIRRAETIAE
ncbi:MAG: hypothetical protein IJU70_14180 [Lentisphaeria bacterium]|nr:hypothetical protein [Lentisphaeria bacterium]